MQLLQKLHTGITMNTGVNCPRTRSWNIPRFREHLQVRVSLNQLGMEVLASPRGTPVTIVSTDAKVEYYGSFSGAGPLMAGRAFCAWVFQAWYAAGIREATITAAIT